MPTFFHGRESVRIEDHPQLTNHDNERFVSTISPKTNRRIAQSIFIDNKIPSVADFPTDPSIKNESSLTKRIRRIQIQYRDFINRNLNPIMLECAAQESRTDNEYYIYRLLVILVSGKRFLYTHLAQQLEPANILDAKSMFKKTRSIIRQAKRHGAYIVEHNYLHGNHSVQLLNPQITQHKLTKG